MKELQLGYNNFAYEAWMVEGNDPEAPRFMLSRLTEMDFRRWPWNRNDLLKYWWSICMKEVSVKTSG